MGRSRSHSGTQPTSACRLNTKVRFWRFSDIAGGSALLSTHESVTLCARGAMGENFFISFNSADRGAAHWIAWIIRRAGHQVAVHDWELPAGGNIPLWMNERLSWATRLIAVISPHYLPALYSQMEWAAKAWQDPTGALGLVVPVIVQPTPKLPPLLTPLSRVELVGCDEFEAERRLLEAIAARSPPSQRPVFTGILPPKPEDQRRLPAAFRPPYRLSNRFFGGRDGILDILERRVDDFFARRRVLVLVGPMGVGKTAIATEHAFRCRSRYRGIWTVNCETAVTAEASFASLADELQLTGQNAPLSERVAAGRKFLAREGTDRPFLLILDNVEEPGDIGAFAGLHGAEFLVTSRNPEWGGTAQLLEVEPLDPAAAVTFLEARAGQTSESGSRLAEALGWLPLALEQAAAYCSECQRSLSSYFHEHEERLSEDRAAPGGDYLSSLAAGVLKSTREAQRADPIASLILDGLAMLAPEPVPRELLYRIGELEGASSSEVDRCLARLRRLALIKLSPETLTIHRAIRAVLRTGLEPRRISSARKLLRAVSKTFPAEPFEIAETWHLCASLWPHVLMLREHQLAAFRRRSERLRYCALLNSAGGWLHATGQYDAAQSTFREVIAWAEPLETTHEVQISSWLNDLAVLLWECGDNGAARSPCRRSLRMGRRRLGESHHLVGTRHNNLALIEEGLERFRFAELHYRVALQIREDRFGPDGWPVINTLANFGDMLRRLKRFEEAEDILSRAKAAAENRSGSPIRLGQVLTALAVLFLDTSRAKQAVPLLLRAEAVFASIYPEAHPSLSKVRTRLASALIASR